MTLDDLEIFVAVCQAESLSAVARELNCTQPAVSQHIARLEKECAIPLLERRARGVVMTKAGRIFYESVQEGLNAIDLAVKQVKQLREGETGSLGIATGGTTIRHLMKDVVATFRRLYPNVQLHFHSANSHERCIDALLKEQADLAFITTGAPIRGLQQYPVIEMPWVLVAAQQDSLANQGNIALKDLQHLPYIRLNKTSISQRQLESTLVNAGIHLTTTTLVDDWDTAILFAGMGLGYAITPILHAQQLAGQDHVQLLPIEGLPPIVFGWAARHWKSLPKVATDFIEIFSKNIDSSAMKKVATSP